MSSSAGQQHTNDSLVDSYSAAVSTTLAHLQERSRQSQHLCRLREVRERQGEQQRALKTRLCQLKNRVNTELNLAQVAQPLQELLIRSQGSTQETVERAQNYNLPTIQVPEMDWALHTLQSITHANFEQLAECIETGKEATGALEATLIKYQERLKVAEEKLAKGYEEARSKKRYL